MALAFPRGDAEFDQFWELIHSTDIGHHWWKGFWVGAWYQAGDVDYENPDYDNANGGQWACFKWAIYNKEYLVLRSFWLWLILV